MKITSFLFLFILAGFTFQSDEKDFQVKTDSPFVLNVRALAGNKLIVSLKSNAKDSVVNRAFTMKLGDYDEVKLNNFFKINYDSNANVTVVSEQINPGFNWIKIENLERKIEIKNGIFPKKSEILSSNRNSDLNIIVILFKMNLNKYTNEQIIQKPVGFDRSKMRVKLLKNNNQETFLVSF